MARDDDQRADEIIEQVFARFQRKVDEPEVGHARATLVLHERVAFLCSPLEEANFHTVIADNRLDEDFEIRMVLLSHRMLVTRNTEDFLDDAPVLDYGIIGLDALPVIDPAAEYKTNRTAQLISKAILDYDLTSERCGFVLVLRQNGHHVFRRLA